MFEVSEKESVLLGYRVARGDLSTLGTREPLLAALKQQRIDVLKLSLRNTPANLYQLLDALALPYYVLGMVVEYKSNFRLNSIKPYLNEQIEFTEYKGEEEDAFKELVKAIFKHMPGSYYLNPGLDKLVDAERQLECLAEYINTLNSSHTPDRYTHLLYYKGELAGFISSYKKGDGGGVNYSGVLKKFEGRGLYLDILSFIQNYGKEIGQKWGTASVQIQNTVGQKALEKGGLFPCAYELSVHVNCFFGNLAGK